jgi:hypothetical protein
LSPSNRTAERLKALDRALAAGKVTLEQADAERKRLAALGDSWEARWTLADGKTERTKTFRGKGAEKKARDHEAEQKLLVKRGEAQDPLQARATVAKVLDFYLAEKMHRDGLPRPSLKNARAHRNNIVAVWGERFTLETLDADPEPHMRRLKRELERKFPGGAWNNKVTLRAALAYWIRRRRLRILNPADVIDWGKPKNARKQRLSFEQHRRAVAAATKVGQAWLPIFLECGWETGWRSGEIQDWRIERLHLEPTGEDFPWVLTLIEKQGEEAPVYEEKPFTFRLAGLLKAVIGRRTEGPLWPLQRTQHDRWVRRALDEAGLGDYRFHDYRRSIKQRLEGSDDGLVADYTGHDEEMHDRYSKAGRDRRDFYPLLLRLEPEKKI